MKCRFCKTKLEHVFIDLGNAPASNSFLNAAELGEPEPYFPLKVFTCHKCFLVQIDEYKKSDAIFNDEYVYFSSFSKSWLNHCKNYVDMMVGRFGFNKKSQIIEVASNDGYLLQYFKEKNIPVLGIEPTKNTAEVARKKGIKTITEFFGVALAKKLVKKGVKADLLLGCNVLAHVPDIVDFIKGIKIILNKSGVVTIEYPHLMQLVENNQFDTVYHEHFSYLSFTVVVNMFKKFGLTIFDVEQIPTHGGSLRIFAKHTNDKTKPVTIAVTDLLNLEKEKGMGSIQYYKTLEKEAYKIKLDLLGFLIEQKKLNKKIAAGWAAAKGNTLLNYCGIKNDLIDYVVDHNPAKQNKFLPGSHIPVYDEEYLRKNKPDYVIILPWNIKEDIMKQLEYIKDWGGKFIIPIPKFKII